MKNSLWRLIVAGMLLLAAQQALALENSTRSYQLPAHGHLQLKVPTGWLDDLRQPEGGTPPTIIFSPTSGSLFQVYITAIFAARSDIVMPDPQKIKILVEKAAVNARNMAVDKTIHLQELSGPAVTGYYFSITVRDPSPGEFKYLTQGMFRVGELTPTFTVLSNDDTGKVLEDSLAMMKSALQGTD